MSSANPAHATSPPLQPLSLDHLNDESSVEELSAMIVGLAARFGPLLPWLYIHPNVTGFATGKERDSWKERVLKATKIGLLREFLDAPKPSRCTTRMAVCLSYSGNWIGHNKDKAWREKKWHCWAMVTTADPSSPVVSGQDVYLYDDSADQKVALLGPYKDCITGAEHKAVRVMLESGYGVGDVKLGGSFLVPGNSVQSTFSWIQSFLLLAANTLLSGGRALDASQTWYVVNTTARNPVTARAEAQARRARPAPPPPTRKSTRSQTPGGLPEIGEEGSVFIPRKTYTKRVKPVAEGGEGGNAGVGLEGVGDVRGDRRGDGDDGGDDVDEDYEP